MTTSVTPFDSYSTMVNNAYLTIYVTQRRVRILENNSTGDNSDHQFTLFDHDTTELSAFIYGDYDFYEIVMYQNNIEIRHIDQSYTITNYK